VRQVALTLAAIGCGLAGFDSPAQTLQTGPHVLTFHSDVDDSDQPYAIYVPRNYDSSRKYPLVMSLHGAGSNHRLNLRRVFGKGNLPGESDAHASRSFPPWKDADFIVVSPLARGTMGYQGIAEKDVYDVLADVKNRFSIDEDRVYLTGLSMGGGGALWLALTRPDIWAAVAAVCPSAPPGTEQFAINALDVPVRLFQGALDPLVPVQSTRQWNSLLEQAGARAEYTEYPRVRHNSWDFAYKDEAIFDWFSQFRRNRFPERVRFVAESYKYSSAYWVQIDGLIPGVAASIEARVTAPNRVTVDTRNVRGFTLKLAGHPSYSSAKPISISIDGQTMRPGHALSFSKGARGWQPTPYDARAGEKRAGAEGPIAEAVSGKHIYVYGTAGSQAIEELEKRRREAQEAAKWSSPQEPLMLNFRVVSDKEADLRDLDSGNLVLFGTKETNDMISRLAPELPIAMNSSAADFGLVFVYPMRGRYVLINSGLYWWTNMDEIGFAGPSFLPLSYRILLSLGDYVLFKGSLENIVASGRFGNDWKIPAGDLEKLRASGAVEIK
jgi:pimeloyl-ACP methyl ester carboxylesterase